MFVPALASNKRITSFPCLIGTSARRPQKVGDATGSCKVSNGMCSQNYTDITPAGWHVFAELPLQASGKYNQLI